MAEPSLLFAKGKGAAPAQVRCLVLQQPAKWLYAEAMAPETSPYDEIEALLRWYIDMGVDIAVDAEPHDRFAEAIAARGANPRDASHREAGARAAGNRPAGERAPRPDDAPQRAAPSARAPGRQAAGSPPLLPLDTAALSSEAVVRSARETAATAQSLEALEAALGAFEGCSLKGSATRLVFADGNPKARIMAVGEAPGADEDRQGKPFVGRSGRLFDLMLGAIGLDRTKVYIANVVPWRPPGNRTPTPQEVAVCLPFIARQIELVDPDVMICVGGSAAQSLLATREGILRLRGRWFDYETGRRRIKVMPMLHPAYLLRQPAHKALAWRDLRDLHKALQAGADTFTPSARI